LKRDVADIAFSNFIRERDDWTCQRCRKIYPEGRRQGLHCSHFFSRRHEATRFYAKNAAAHCFSCHQYLGGNPIEFSEWIKTHLGDETFEKLRAKKETIKKKKENPRKEIAKHWREQLKELRQCRENQTKYEVLEYGE